MTRLLLFLPAISLALPAAIASAPFASAQTPVFEVRDASGATLHFAVNDDGTVTCTNCMGTATLQDRSVTADKLDIGACTSETIADESVTADKLAGGIYNAETRSSVYSVEGTFEIADGEELGRGAVYCVDPDDIALTGGCGDPTDAQSGLRLAGSDFRVIDFNPVNWPDPDDSAGYSCSVAREEGEPSAVAFEVRVHCLDLGRPNDELAAGSALPPTLE